MGKPGCGLFRSQVFNVLWCVQLVVWLTILQPHYSSVGTSGHSHSEEASFDSIELDTELIDRVRTPA